MRELVNFVLRNWILLVILGNFFIAVSNIVSKVVISGSVSKPLNPAPYAFWSGFGGIVPFSLLIVVNFVWLDFWRSGLQPAGFGIAAGFFLIISLWPFYTALSRNEASRVMTLFVGGVPLFTFLIKFFFLKERLGVRPLLAFVFLVAGGILASLKQYEDGRLSVKDTALTLISALGIALGLVLADITFKVQGFFEELAWKGFLSGMTWIMVGYVLASLVIYFWPGQKKKIVATGDYATKANVFWVFTEKILGTSGSTIIKYSISLVGATLVNAFEGLKQFFVLILAALLSWKYPQILEEEMAGVVLWQKIIAAFFIFAGILLLSLNTGLMR